MIRSTDKFDLQKIREDFPILTRKVRDDKALVYLDNAATTLKPRQVLDAVYHHYAHGASNIHRGVHFLSEEATRLYENSREKIRNFIGAKDLAEIIFTSGTTAGINLIAKSWGAKNITSGDEVIITHMEHHANIVPWQMLREATGCTLKVAPINDCGELILDEFERLVTPRTKMIAVVYTSNSLGTVNPVDKIIKIARAKGAKNCRVLLDAAQTVAHARIDVQSLDCDFLVFSGHKLFATSGVGVLYGKREVLDTMPPLMGGGDMIKSVTFEKTTYAGLPARLEAGTPSIGGAIGLGTAIDYINRIGFDAIADHEHDLLTYATSVLYDIPGLKIIGTAANKTSILSFVVDGIHPHDMGTLLDAEGVAVRAGHHCTQPVMSRFGVPATTRASFSFYNTRADADALAAAVRKAIEVFA
jgi:cysteine desulfurase/selenocysteine lyase